MTTPPRQCVKKARAYVIVNILLDRKPLSRDTRRLARLLQLARLKHNATLEDLATGASRGLDRLLVGRLASCDWIRQGQAVIITGATGTGKTCDLSPEPRTLS